MLNRADIENFDEMSNRDKYYTLYEAYKLIEYLSTKHEINESQLNSTLNIIRSLGTIYGAKAEVDALKDGEAE
jgi:hypothetical protein